MDRETLKQRTKQFGLRAIRVVDALPKTMAGRTIGAQFLRSSTSVGANYRAACRARSRKEFIAKIGIVTEESDESAFWLELMSESELVKANRVAPLLREAEELTAIFARTRKSTINKSQINKSTNSINRKPKNV